MIGKQYVAITALAVVCCGQVRGASGEEVEVVCDTADLRLGSQVVGAVKRGDRLAIVQRQHPWICVRSGPTDSATKGWLLCSEVQTYVAPGVDEETAAPPGFGDVRAEVNGTHYLATRPYVLCLKLTLSNDGWQAVPFDATKIEIEVAGRVWNALPPGVTPEFRGGNRSLPLIENGVVQRQRINEIEWLGAGNLAPGEKVSGWIGFPISVSPMSTGPRGRQAPTWTLYIPLGDKELPVDLLEKEVEDVVIRPAEVDAAISVLELGPRVNAVNFATVEEGLDKLLTEGRGFLIRFTTPICSVDDYARFAFRPVAARLAKAKADWVFVIPRQQGHNDLGSILGGRVTKAISEEAGLAILRSWRDGGSQAPAKRPLEPSPSTQPAPTPTEPAETSP